MKVDWLFKNVTVIDGSGGPQYRGDVAVKGDRIVDIAPALNVAADREIDGEGRVLAPGFIDVHTHDDINVIRIPEYLPKLSQGVTTVIVGNCGISAATAKPASGESSSDRPMSIAFCQFTPSASDTWVSRALARPTPRIEPIRVCELEAGMPKYQVPRFQAMAEVSRENTITRPCMVVS